MNDGTTVSVCAVWGTKMEYKQCYRFSAYDQIQINMEWNSTNLIGKVKEHYKDVFREDRRWNVWRGFYNGWLDGRADMLKAIRKETPMAYEYHNHKTGHCFVDYDLGEAIPEGIENIKDYVKTPLHKI